MPPPQTLIIKETNDVAISLLVRTLPTLLNHLLACSTPIPADVTTLVQGDEQCQAGYEASVRQRRRCRSVGPDAVSESINDATKAFAISSALEGCTRTTSANPLGTTGSFGRVRRLGHLAQSLGSLWHLRYVFVFILAVTVSHVSDNGTDHELTGTYFILIHIL